MGSAEHQSPFSSGEEEWVRKIVNKIPESYRVAMNKAANHLQAKPAYAQPEAAQKEPEPDLISFSVVGIVTEQTHEPAEAPPLMTVPDELGELVEA